MESDERFIEQSGGRACVLRNDWDLKILEFLGY